MQTKADRIIFFDIYQTLIDIDIDEAHKKANEAKGWEAFVKSLEQYDVHITPAKFLALSDRRKEDFYAGKDKKVHHHNLFKLTTQTLREDLKIGIADADVASLLSEYHKIARGYARLYPRVVETLAELEKHYTLAVASYTQGCYTKTELKELGIERFFTHFIYTSDIGFHKASREFYKQCLATVGKGAEDCVMIGDNYDVDVLVPQKLGMKTIWVKNPATAAQYAPSLPQGGERIIDLEKFVHLPEVIDDIFN